MKVVTIPSAPDATALLTEIEELRAQVEAGEVVAFALVCLRPDDSFRHITQAAGAVTRLRMQGGIAQLLHDFLSETADTAT